MDLATVEYCSSVVMYEKLPSDMVEGLRSRARREPNLLSYTVPPCRIRIQYVYWPSV